MRRRRRSSASMEREGEDAKDEEDKDNLQCSAECARQRGGKMGGSGDDHHDGPKGGQSGEGEMNEAMEGSGNECEEDSRRLSGSMKLCRGTWTLCFWAIAVAAVPLALAVLFGSWWFIAIRNGDAMRTGEHSWGNRLLLNFARRWLLVTPGTDHFLLRPEAGNGVAFPESDVSPVRVDRLPFPLLWMAPFLSGGGYCSEAITYLSALDAVLADRRSLEISQHGDGFNMKFWRGLPESTKTMINAFASRGYMSPASTVVICHR
ncbi:hypothetical protein CBR_g29367 [Chara braunii]|uniref:Uncharacterized protein n=1 Tax=Chara braunii TaxID=69332 RepID=A0A388JWL7_CHABU|nr:hypothetical protein CBR_g29367 [Chara braunii]|eukprot:GBG62168.1 hypothetical protein CBR_g29367 [Chara braunii]